MSLCCPRCSQPLQTLHTTPRGSERQYRLERCLHCGGLWLDRDELAEICPTLSDLPERALEIRTLGSPSEHVRRCPRCESIPYSFRVVDLEVDCCVGCGGVWLDEAEHEEIARGVDPDDRESAAAGRRDPYRAMQHAAQKGRVRCVSCTASEWLADTYMTAAGLTCWRCFAAGLGEPPQAAAASSTHAAELGEPFRPLSWLARLADTVAGLPDAPSAAAKPTRR